MSFTLSLLRFELVEIVESPLRCRVFCREPEKIKKAKLRVKNQNLKYFDAKLRFALLASLRSAIFTKIYLKIKKNQISYFQTLKTAGRLTNSETGFPSLE